MQTSGDGAPAPDRPRRALLPAPALLSLVILLVAATPAAAVPAEALADAPPTGARALVPVEPAPLPPMEPHAEAEAAAPDAVSADAHDAVGQLARAVDATDAVDAATAAAHDDAPLPATPPFVRSSGSGKVKGHLVDALNATDAGGTREADDAPTTLSRMRRALATLEPEGRERLHHAPPALAHRIVQALALSPSEPGAVPQAPAQSEPPLYAQAVAPDVPAPVAAHRLSALAAGAALILITPWLLYHRLRGHRALAQKTRADVFDLVRARPGIGAAEVARELGLDRTTARYHLRRLEREELLTTEGSACFVAGTLPREARAARIAAQRARRVLDEVRAGPGRTKNELAQALGLARATVCWHLDRLAAAGLVRLDRDGRAVRARVDEAALRDAGLW